VNRRFSACAWTTLNRGYLLLRSGLDGGQRQERRSHQPNKQLHDTVTADYSKSNHFLGYNERVANAVALQTVVDQTRALHALKSNRVRIDPADWAFLSPYPTSKLKRFGDYPTNLMPEAMPITTTLPV
jgi:Tn3 transposase DDE domain